jgi:hypothetical protein
VTTQAIAPDASDLPPGTEDSLGFSLFCAMAPMIAGVATLLAYALTFAVGFAFFGLLVILGGSVLFLIGTCTALVGQFRLRKAAASPVVTRAKRQFRTRFVLLLANLPLALACFWAGTTLMSLCTVDVVNDTGAMIDDCKIEAFPAFGGMPSHTSHLGAIPPGGHARAYFLAQDSGHATATITQAGRTEKLIAVDYMTGGVGSAEHARLTVGAGITGRVELLPR